MSDSSPKFVMLSSKRTLTKDEPNEKEIRSKRVKTFESTIVPMMTTDSIFNANFDDILGDDITLLKPRSALTTRDLPTECLHGFRVSFKPAIREFVGAHAGPWESPPDADVIRIWDTCFPKHRLEASKNLHTIVSKLVDDTIQHWRWDIGTTAVEFLNTYLKNSFKTPSERAARAAWLLGDDEKDRKRPFYYRIYANGVQPSGIFQSPMIAATLAAHLSSISGLPEKSRLTNYPVGALVLSILAVKRALTWAKTGVDIPKTPEGNFSRANWGDHYKLTNGRYVFVNTASRIIVVVNKLHDIHWERILAVADEYASKRRVPAALETLFKEEGGLSDDFELEDWDDDFE